MGSYIKTIGLCFAVFLFSSHSWAEDDKIHTVDLKIESRMVIGHKVIKVTQGQSVQLRWSTDEEVSLHLHGYNIKMTATPAKPSPLAFIAKATGRFPVTSHGFGKDARHHGHGKTALIYVEVYPK